MKLETTRKAELWGKTVSFGSLRSLPGLNLQCSPATMCQAHSPASFLQTWLKLPPIKMVPPGSLEERTLDLASCDAVDL